MAMPRAAYHPLRRWLIFAFPLAVLLSTINVIMGNIFPIVALPIVAVSAFVSAVCLLRHDQISKQPGSVKLGKRSRACSLPVQSFFLVVYDAFWATGIMVVLGFSWDSLGWGNTGLAAATAYATVPYLVAFLVHAYLGFMTLFDMTGATSLFHWFSRRQVTCPNCHSCLNCEEPDLSPSIGHFRDSNRGYTIVTAKSVQTPYDENAASEAGDVDESTGLMAPGQDEEVHKSDDGNVV